jgi:Domain of unknown function (DUF4382)
MGGARSSPGRIRAIEKLLFTISFFAFALIGCGDSCVIFVSNPGGGGGGTLSGGTPTCSFSPMNGKIRLRISSSVAVPKSGGQAEIQHIFVTIRGIEATTNAFAGDESPDWKELTPNLAAQEVQLDLLAQSGESCGGSSFESAAIPADTYRQVRLSLSSNQPAESDSTSQENLCGSSGVNCIETSDGKIRPLVLDSKFSRIQVSSDHIRGGFFQVFPETPANLRIEFNSQSSLFIPAGEGVRMIPVFMADTQTACESATSAER